MNTIDKMIEITRIAWGLDDVDYDASDYDGSLSTLSTLNLPQ